MHLFGVIRGFTYFSCVNKFKIRMQSLATRTHFSILILQFLPNWHQFIKQSNAPYWLSYFQRKK